MSDTANDTATGVALDTGTGASGSGGNGGSSAGDAGGADTGSKSTTGSTDAWYSGIADEGLRSLAQSKGWADPEAALKSYKELETAFSAKGDVPKPPAKADDYKFEAPKDIPEGVYNSEFANWFKGAAHKAGLAQEAASAIHDQFVEFAKGSFGAQAQAAQDALTKRVTDAQRDLETAWGSQDSPTFKRNTEMAMRAIRHAEPGLMDALREVGAIVDVQGRAVVANPTIVKALARVGEGMYAEDKFSGTPTLSKNPFADGSEDLAMQGRLVQTDPDKAVSLIRAAGKDKMFAQFLERHTRRK